MTRIEQLEGLMAREPDDAFLNFGLAIELAKLKRFDESVSRFDRVLEIDPNYIAAHHHKALTLVAKGDVAAAKQELERGVQAAGACGEMHAKSEMSELLDSL